MHRIIVASVLQSMAIQIKYNDGNCNAILCSECNSNNNHLLRDKIIMQTKYMQVN